MSLVTPKTQDTYDTAFTYVLKGIPCTVVLREVSLIKAIPAQVAHSDIEVHGELYFDAYVYDRKGYHAPWLQRKLTDQDYENFTLKALYYLGIHNDD